MSTQKYSIPITLTSVNDPPEKRHLTITQGAPTTIGRASKSESKNLSASPTNALFDCPVVSREHAELKANPWASTTDQITITDKGSTHGTRVNGSLLQKNIPMSLRSGDVIQLGSRVMRDSETHDGVVVTFQRVYPRLPDSLAAAGTSQTQRGYQVPSDSEYDSDYRSEDEEDEASSVSSSSNKVEPGHSSSSLSPELSKKTPGSQEEPIDVDNILPPRPTVINLEDDYYSPPPANTCIIRDDEVSRFDRPTKFNPSQVIQDSVGKNPDILVADSLPHAPHRRISPAYGPYGDAVGAPPPGYVAGPRYEHSLLNDGIDIDVSSDIAEDGVDSDSDDDVDYPNEDEDADHRSESDNSEMNDDYEIYGDLSEDNGEEEEEGNSYSAQREASPELGSAASSQPRKPVNAIEAVLARHNSQPKPATGPHFDPVRASQNCQPMAMTTNPPWNPMPALPKPYVAEPPVLSATGYPPPQAPSTDFYCSSRWDVLPDSFESWNAPPFFTHPAPYRNPPHMAPFPPPAQPQCFESGRPYDIPNTWTEPPKIPDHPYTFPNTMARDLSQQTPADTTVPASAKGKTKISIPDIVETDKEAQKPLCEAPTTLEKHKSQVSSSTAPKRKAAEMDNTALPTGSSSAAGSTVQKPEVQEPEIQEPPARRRKIRHYTSHHAVPEKARYAAGGAVLGAVSGVVGTMAFLCSPLAEKLVDWLA